MRMEIAFTRALTREERCLAQMGLAALAGTRAVVFATAGTRAFVSGEALHAGAIESALRSDGLPVSTVTGADFSPPPAVIAPSAPSPPSTPSAPAGSGGVPIIDERERYRPIGR